MSTPRQRSSSASSPSVKHSGKVAVSPAVPPQTPASLPAANDRDGWRAHWQAQGQPWRTEPEIDQKRQAELKQRRAIVPDIEKGVYPFKGIKLDRADVEWLTTTHSGRLQIDWSRAGKQEQEGLDLRGADLSYADLSNLPLPGLCAGLAGEDWFGTTTEQRALAVASMNGVNFNNANLEKASFNFVSLEGGEFRGASLEDAQLRHTHLEGADFRFAHLESAHLRGAHLAGTNLREAYLEGIRLEDVNLSDEGLGGPLLADAHWGETNLAVVNWSQVNMLGDERQARQCKAKSKFEHLKDYERAVRANRQLAVTLQGQGLNENAVRFAYRAQVLQKTAFRLQMVQLGISFRRRMQLLGAWLFSWFLFLIAGYGYKPSRSFLAYLLVISSFATAYYILGHTTGPLLSPLGAFVFSMTSFHGRGFFPGNNISLDDPLTVLAAFEALVGLIIEVTFIATLTQRFFNR